MDAVVSAWRDVGGRTRMRHSSGRRGMYCRTTADCGEAWKDGLLSVQDSDHAQQPRGIVPGNKRNVRITTVT